jgi:hypothetical protein
MHRSHKNSNISVCGAKLEAIATPEEWNAYRRGTLAFCTPLGVPSVLEESPFLNELRRHPLPLFTVAGANISQS